MSNIQFGMTGAHLTSLDVERWTLNVGRSSLLAAFLGFLCLAITAQAALILPTEDGMAWEYSRVGAEPAAVTVRLVGKEQVVGKELLKLETLGGDQITKTELISVDERGVLCHQRAGADGKATVFDPPQVLIPAELKAGKTWELDDEVAGGAMRQQWSVVAEQEVEVPAGKFRAFRLRCEQPWPISIAIERWFVPGIGMIKDVTTTRGPTGRLLSRVALTLKETPRVVSVSTTSPTPEAAPSATAGPIAITLQLASEREGEPQTEYRSDVENIFVWWRGENLPVDSFVRVAWIAEDVGEVAPANFIVDETETEITASEFSARFTLSRPKDGWAAGKYRAELYLNDELREKVSVLISD